MHFLVSEPQAIDLRAVAGSNESFDVVVADERHDRRELVLGEECLDLQVFLSAVTAFDGIDRASANEGIHDVLADTIGFVGDDVDAFAFIERGSEIVNCQAVDPGSDDTDDDHAEIVDEERGAADDDTSDSNRCADIEMEVLVHDLTQYIQSSGGGIDAEQDGLTDTKQEHEADEIEPHIAISQTTAHHAVAYADHPLTGVVDQVVIACERTGIELVNDGLIGDQFVRELIARIDAVPHLGERTEDECRIDSLGAELVTNQDESQQEQERVDARYPVGEGVCRAAEQGVEHDGQTRDRAYDKVTRH